MTTSTLERRYNWFKNYHSHYGYAPTLREMGEGLHLSRTGARSVLNKMEEVGWVQVFRNPQGRMIARSARPTKVEN